MISKPKVLELLRKLDLKMGQENIKGEIGVLGGVAMMFGFNARESTHDVDVVLDCNRPNLVMALAHEVGEEEGLQPGWLNDAVSVFVPDVKPKGRILLSLPNLVVWCPDARYLLAMKALASRPQDLPDIETLVKACGFTTALEVFETLKLYYPKRKQIPKRSQDMILGLFEET